MCSFDEDKPMYLKDLICNQLQKQIKKENPEQHESRSGKRKIFFCASKLL